MMVLADFAPTALGAAALAPIVRRDSFDGGATFNPLIALDWRETLALEAALLTFVELRFPLVEMGFAIFVSPDNSAEHPRTPSSPS